MGQHYRVGLRKQFIEDVGKRMVELQEKLGFSSLEKLGYHCMLEPGSLRRLVRDKKSVPSFEFLARMCMRIPNININWLISGHGHPLVDWDMVNAGESYEEIMANLYLMKADVKALGAAALLIEAKIDISISEENRPSTFNTYWEEELKRNSKPVTDPRKVGLGRFQLSVLKKMEKGNFITIKNNVAYLTNGKFTKTVINSTIPASLEVRGLIRREGSNYYINVG
jgi:hypothetical protein